ncbi:hypothetical protein ACFW04_007966 [Cataglyphis niger]
MILLFIYYLLKNFFSFPTYHI